MATTTEKGTVEVPAIELNSKVSRLFTIIAIAAIVVGIGSALGGLGGMIYTYQSAAVENITTPDDAVFAEVPDRWTLSGAGVIVVCTWLLGRLPARP